MKGAGKREHGHLREANLAGHKPRKAACPWRGRRYRPSGATLTVHGQGQGTAGFLDSESEQSTAREPGPHMREAESRNANACSGAGGCHQPSSALKTGATQRAGGEPLQTHPFVGFAAPDSREESEAQGPGRERRGKGRQGGTGALPGGLPPSPTHTQSLVTEPHWANL